MAPPSRRGRKRKPVSHYTDDNPSTFTTKTKRGSPATTRAAVSSPLVEEEQNDDPPPPRRRRNNHKRPLLNLVCHEHDMREEPVVPQTLVSHPSNNLLLGQITGPPLPKPEWTMVATPYEHEIHPPRMTCMATCGNYMALGNILGEVLLYALEPLVIHIATLPTTASQRQPATKKKRNDATIHALALHGTQICLATSLEVECYNALDHSMLWRLCLTGGETVTKLDIHPTENKVLCCFADMAPWLLWHRDTNDDKNETDSVRVEHILPSFRKCTAIWDLVDSNRMIVVASTANEQQKLSLVDASQQNVLCSTFIPTKGKLVESSISQFAKYTCVASTRGVRVYDTDSLELLNVYGDGVTLHGHTLVYQEGFVMDGRGGGGGANDYDDDTTTDSMWVVGVPHAHREPRELQETLQLWQWWDTVHPSHTLHGPPRSQGLARVWAKKSGGLLALTQAGDVWQLLPTRQTDWPGVMYPPGYKVIMDNVDYIEDEDEVDIVEEFEEDFQEEEEELAEAMRLSIMEQDVVVVDEQEDESIVIPCHPDPRLKEPLQQDTTCSSPQRPSPAPSFLQQVLDSFPNRQAAKSAFIRIKQRPTVEAESALPKPIRGKRSRASNLETMIKASLDPELRKLMLSKEQWADGEGSALREVDKVPLQFEVAETESITLTKNEQGVKSDSSTALHENGTTDSETRAAIISNEKRINVETDNKDAKLSAAVGINGDASTGTWTVLRDTTEAKDSGADATISAEGLQAEPSSEGNCKSAEPTSLELFSEAVPSRPMDDAATSALEGMLALQRSFSEDNSPGKNSAGSTIPTFPPFDTDQDFTLSNATVSLAETFEMASPTTNLQSTDVINGPDICVRGQWTERSDQSADNGKDDDQPGSQAIAPTEDDSKEKEGAANIDDVTSREPAALVANSCAGGNGKDSSAPDVVSENNLRNPEARLIPVGVVDIEMADNTMDATSHRVAAINGFSKTEFLVVSPSEESTTTPFAEGALNLTSKDTEATNTALDSRKVDAKEHDPVVFCSACRGRMVIHTCGKREIPVDFEAIARAEREQHEKEEEEKKALRVQKRREADARRRDTKRKKKEEEEKQRREEERQRRIIVEEMERARVQTEYEEQVRTEDYDKEKRRAEMWARLRTTDGGHREDETYAHETYSDRQVNSGPPQHAYNTVPASYAIDEEQNLAPQSYHHHLQDVHQNGGYPMQQQPRYSPSYEQRPLSVSQYMVKSAGIQPSFYPEHDNAPHYQQQLHIQQNDSTMQTQATNSFSFATQPLVAQPTNYRTSYEQHNSVQPQSTYTAVSAALQALPAQHQYSETYEQQHVPVSHSPVDSHAASTNHDINAQLPYDSAPSYEQPQTQFGSDSGSDDQEATEPGSLHRLTSAQLGTAEALASLASMCAQMKPVEPATENVYESTANGTRADSYSQPSSATVGQSVSLNEAPASGHVETAPRSEPVNIGNSAQGDSYSQPSSATIGQSLNDNEAPSTGHVESALESEPVDMYLGYPVGGQFLNPCELRAPGHIESMPQSEPVNEARDNPIEDGTSGWQWHLSSKIGTGATDLRDAGPTEMPPPVNAGLVNDANEPKPYAAAPVMNDISNDQIDTATSQNNVVPVTTDGDNQDHR